MIKLIIANWKMNFTLPEATSSCEFLQDNEFAKELIVCAPSLYIGILVEKFAKIKFAAQNTSEHAGFGSYTGQCSSVMLKSCGAKYVLLGHSECREYLHEINQQISEKASHCINDDLIPIICVGESFISRAHNNHIKDVLEQLAESLPASTVAITKKIIIAYEPIWSIGTGLVPNDQQLTEIFYHLHHFMKQSLFANEAQLVYGGSVNIDNISRLSAIKYIDGLLLGKASLDKKQLLEILNFKTTE